MTSPKLYRKVFRWEDLPEEEVRRGVRRKAYSTDDVMLVMNELTPGMDLAPHKHDDFDQLAYILKGAANYYIEDVPYEMGPGSLLLVPRGAMHYIEPVGDESCLNLDIFVPPRSDLLHLIAYLNDAVTVDGGSR